MALFSNLHHVSEVMVQVISDHLSALPTGGVHSGAPLDDPKTASEQVRVTLLWTTPQPSHRNDPWERTAAGNLTPPPLTLSGYFLITTYGLGTDDEPVRAHELLGNVMQAFHTQPEMSLPLGTLPDRGDGPLSIVLVPTAADLMEKVYAPLQQKHRPWALYEVGPIQLDMLAAETAAGPVVRPGGVRLGDLAVAERPAIARITPARQAQGGRVRVDVDLQGRALTQVHVGELSVDPGALTTLSEDAFVLTLSDTPPDVVPAGPRRVLVQTGDSDTPPLQFSDAAPIEVLDPAAATVDAPLALEHSTAGPLTLSGRGLAEAQEVLVWPDEGVAEPADIVTLAVGTVTDTSVEITAATLQAAGLEAGLDYRLTVRVDTTQRYTPFVLMRFGA